MGYIRRYWFPASATIMVVGWILGALSGPHPDSAFSQFALGTLFVGVALALAGALVAVWRVS